MFLLPCSRWVPGATPPGESRLRRRRSSRRHGTRVSPRHSSERRRQVVRTIEACSCSCCSAPSDRDKSADRSPALRMNAVALLDAPLERSPYVGQRSGSWFKVKVRHEGRFLVGGIVDNDGDFGGVLVRELVAGDLLYRGIVEWSFTGWTLTDPPIPSKE